jgi:hypothetical protein
VNPVTEPTLEAIAVRERHERLQIFLFPVVWSDVYRERITGNLREQIAQLLAFGFLYLPGKK